jgi:hypothetical protein
MKYHSLHRISAVAAAVLGSLALAGLASCNHSVWRLETLPVAWRMDGFEHSLDLSGIAAASATQCLVGSDESFYVQPGLIDPATRRIHPLEPIPLPVEAASRKVEVDIEGIAFAAAERAYYVVGSHGVGKKKADFQPARHSVYRVPLRPDSDQVQAAAIERSSLLPWLEKTPLLVPYVKRQLQQNGLNIEGLAYANGRLFFGLRAPNKDGRGLVIELAAAELFGGPPKPLTVHELALPRGRGIREVVAVSDGFLLLTGNASAEATKKFPTSQAPGPDTRFELLHWNGRDSVPANIGTLPASGGKAEGLLVLAETDRHIDALVIFDGLPDGRPLTVRAHRRR